MERPCEPNGRQSAGRKGHAIVLIVVALLIGCAIMLRLERSVLRDDAAASGASAFNLRIDLNAATEAELQLLPQVGERLAERIVEDREEHGPFQSLDDLMRVRGVGRVTIERIAPFATVDHP